MKFTPFFFIFRIIVLHICDVKGICAAYPFAAALASFVRMAMIYVSISLMCVFFLVITIPPEVIILHQGVFCLLFDFADSVHCRGFQNFRA